MSLLQIDLKLLTGLLAGYCEYSKILFFFLIKVLGVQFDIKSIKHMDLGSSESLITQWFVYGINIRER